MKNFTENIRQLRKKKKVTLRLVADFLNIEIALLSKIERGQCKASHELVIKLAEYYNVNENELLIAWLSDNVVYEIPDEIDAKKVFQVAEEKVNYKKSIKLNKPQIIDKIIKFFQKDGRIAKAWIFGSFARGDYNNYSDIDLMVKYNNPEKVSLFDFAEIAYLLEQKIKIKVDLVEEGYIKPFAWETAKNDIKLIYG